MKAVGGLFVLVFVSVGCATTDPGQVHASPHEHTTPQVHRNPQVDSESQQCLALAMYWEARGEGRMGMTAVGSVVLNRMIDDRFPDTACEVVHEGGEMPPCQFSWWCDGKSDRPTQTVVWQSSLTLAGEMLTERPADQTHGAIFFHATSVRKPWQRTKTTRIGNHIFYR